MQMLRIIFSLLIMAVYGFTSQGNAGGGREVSPWVSTSDSIHLLYHSLGLEGQVCEPAFVQAVSGYRKIGQRSRNILTIIDFSKPSTEERLFVIDMDHQQLIHSSVVSHGRNSGGNYATQFSNKSGSYKSSLGFYLTASTYIGKNGYSLLLDGLEKGVNDNARSRAIVVHGADYANPSVIGCSGRLGRSLGCPALPQKCSRGIIDDIKGGSVMFIYADQPDYLAQSSILDSSMSKL